MPPNLHSSIRSYPRTSKHDPAPLAQQPSGAPLPLCPAPTLASARGPRPPHPLPGCSSRALAGTATLRGQRGKVSAASLRRALKGSSKALGCPPRASRLALSVTPRSALREGRWVPELLQPHSGPSRNPSPTRSRGKERQQKVPLTGPGHGSLRQRRVRLRGGAVVAASLSAAKAGALLPSETPHARAGPANPIPPRRPPSRPPLFSSPQEPDHPFPPSSAVAQRGDAGLPWRAGPCPPGRGARAAPTARLEPVPPQSRYRHRPDPGRYRTLVSVTGPLQRQLLAPPNGQGATV